MLALTGLLVAAACVDEAAWVEAAVAKSRNDKTKGKISYLRFPKYTDIEAKYAYLSLL